MSFTLWKREVDQVIDPAVGRPTGLPGLDNGPLEKDWRVDWFQFQCVEQNTTGHLIRIHRGKGRGRKIDSWGPNSNTNVTQPDLLSDSLQIKHCTVNATLSESRHYQSTAGLTHQRENEVYFLQNYRAYISCRNEEHPWGSAHIEKKLKKGRELLLFKLQLWQKSSNIVYQKL